MTHFLSFGISRNRQHKTFTINQATYIHDLIETHFHEDARSVLTPCDDLFKDLCKNNDTWITISHAYCSLIGALLGLSNGTRRNINFSVYCLSSFISNPNDIHWKAAQRVLVYVRDMSDYSITLGGSNITLSGHSDLDCAEQRDNAWPQDLFSALVHLLCLGNLFASLQLPFHQPRLSRWHSLTLKEKPYGGGRLCTNSISMIYQLPLSSIMTTRPLANFQWILVITCVPNTLMWSITLFVNAEVIWPYPLIKSQHYQCWQIFLRKHSSAWNTLRMQTNCSWHRLRGGVEMWYYCNQCFY